jgi:uncharacterized membrane protein
MSFLSALVFGFSGFMMKVGCENGHTSPTLLFGMYVSGTLLFALSLILQHHWELSLIVLASSVIIGLGSAIGNDYTIRALATGPATITSPLLNFNIILIVLMSVYFFDERLKITESIAILLFIASGCLLSLDPRETLGIKGDNYYKWLGFIAIAVFFIFLRNGGLKITQEMGLNNTLVLFYAYLFSLVLISVRFLPERKIITNNNHNNINNTNITSHNNKGLLIGCFAGIFSYGGMELYAYSLQIGPASIVAAIFSLRSLVMVVMAMVVYKERLTFYQKLSLLTLFIGVIVISL